MPGDSDRAADTSGRNARETAHSALRAPNSALILASASPRRRELLSALGVPFGVVAADVDETVLPGEGPGSAAARLAQAKADAVARLHGSALVLGADTVVVLRKKILGKPRDAEDAAEMLHALRGREHTVVTGVALVTPDPSARRPAQTIATAVRMRPYNADEIAASIVAGTPFDKAGAYAIQDAEFAPVAGITGCYCNVVGLPLWHVYRIVRHCGTPLALMRPDVTRAVCRTCPMADPV